MKTETHTVMIPLCDGFEAALKHFLFLDLDLSRFMFIFLYAVGPSQVFGTNKHRNRMNISVKILQSVEANIIPTFNLKIKNLLPGISPKQFIYRFEIGSWGDAIEIALKNEKCDLLLLGYKTENTINRLFGGFYATIFQISPITTIVVKDPS